MSRTKKRTWGKKLRGTKNKKKKRGMSKKKRGGKYDVRIDQAAEQTRLQKEKELQDYAQMRELERQQELLGNADMDDTRDLFRNYGVNDINARG